MCVLFCNNVVLSLHTNLAMAAHGSGWSPSGSKWTASVSTIRARLRTALDLDAAAAAPVLAALSELQAPELLTVQEGRWSRCNIGAAAFGLLLLRPELDDFAATLQDARERLQAVWGESPGFSKQLLETTPDGLNEDVVQAAVAAARQLLQRAPRLPVAQAATAPRPPVTPRPVSAAGQPVRYLTDEQKAALNAKYGKLKPPSPAEMSAVLSSGANCKMQ